MNDFALSQIFAGISFAFGLASVQFKSRRSILLCLIVSVTFNSVHFYYLDRPEPSALMLLIGLRYLVAVFTTDRKVMFVFLVFNIVTFALTFTSLLSLLALIGAMLGTYGSFQPAERQIRLYFMGGNICWLTHNIAAWTPVGTLMETAFLISSLIGFWRHFGSPLKRAIPDT